nr:MAG TPA: hypothetical protein [Caudoviricetes sp.]
MPNTAASVAKSSSYNSSERNPLLQPSPKRRAPYPGRSIKLPCNTPPTPSK